jgi:hypothetical protein
MEWTGLHAQRVSGTVPRKAHHAGSYGNSFKGQGPPCPPPMWEPAWPLDLSTVPDPYSSFSPAILCQIASDFCKSVYIPALSASRWAWVNFDWSDGASTWQTYASWA